MQREFAPGREQYAAFLAIDTDRSELNCVRHLSTENETICTYDPSHHERKWNQPKSWSAFCSDEQLVRFSWIPGGGTDGRRALGRMGLRNKNSNIGIDEQIVNALFVIRENVLLPMIEKGTFRVYVIGSLNGGTCSGTFLDMPALIRKGIRETSGSIQINAILYLPNAQLEMSAPKRSQMEANAYAALKELNYYEGLNMRRGYQESWPYNDPAEPTLRLEPYDDFYHVPILVGSRNITGGDRFSKTKDMVVEFLSASMRKQTDEFGLQGTLEYNNIVQQRLKNTSLVNPQAEDYGEAHEFPHRFAAIGAARAAVPTGFVRDCLAGMICQKAGLYAVSPEERKMMAAGMKGDDILPYRREDDLLTASEGNRIAEQLIVPIVMLMKNHLTPGFSYRAVNRIEPLRWKELHDGKYDAIATAVANKYVADHTSTAQLEKLDKYITEAWADYRENVKNYIAKEGPVAFCSVFEGKFLPEHGIEPVGIRRMLENLRDGKVHDTGRPKAFRTADIAAQELAEKKRAVTEMQLSLFEVVAWEITGKAKRQVEEWETAYNNWVDARVNDVRREHVLGTDGSFERLILQPMNCLAQRLEHYAAALSTFSTDCYFEAERLREYSAFKKATEYGSDVNTAAVNLGVFSLFRNEMLRVRDAADPGNIRKLLSNVMVDNREYCADGEACDKADDAVLFNEIIERFLSECCAGGNGIDFSVKHMFELSNGAGEDADTFAYRIISELLQKSRLCIDGNMNTETVILQIPTALDTEIKNSLIRAAGTASLNCRVSETENENAIGVYCISDPFAVYQLRELKYWENEYEKYIGAFRDYESDIHCKSPDGEISWSDYPSITISEGDPTKPDDFGRINAEGQRRLAMKKTLDEAREKGILYSEQDAWGNWRVYRVYFDPKCREWNLNVDALENGNGNPLAGKGLQEAIARQNSVALADVSRQVCLDFGGVFDPQASCPDEALAWERAYRVLYSHIPMFAEIREMNRILYAGTGQGEH